MRKSKIILFFILSNIILSQEGLSQSDKSKKVEINITSSFKPSIIKSSKIEFRPESLGRDTTPYKLKYKPVPFSFTTPLNGFTIKPLAYKPEKIENQLRQLSVQLGFGNLRSPQANISYAEIQKNNTFSIYADFLSMKGTLPSQQHAVSDFGVSFKKHITDSYQYNIDANVQNFNYRTYGFQNPPAVPVLTDDLKQHFTNFNVLATLTNATGDSGKIRLRPTVNLDYLSTNFNFNTFTSLLTFPLQYQWKKNILLKTDASLAWTNLSSSGNNSTKTLLVKIPIGATMEYDKLHIDLLVFPAYFERKLNILPNLILTYPLTKNQVTLSAGFKSNYEITTPYKLLLFNPFVRPALNAPVYQIQSFFAGWQLYNYHGLNITGEIGFASHKNLPLFINSGLFGKDFKPIFESSIKTFGISTNISYCVHPQFEINSDIKWTHFTQQSDYLKAFGLLPFDMQFNFKWKPKESFYVAFNTNLWAGTFAKNTLSTDIEKMKTVAELNLELNYTLTKQWSLWLDLNNLTNVQYQRWNQYAAYGFNFRGGVKYTLRKATN